MNSQLETISSAIGHRLALLKPRILANLTSYLKANLSSASWKHVGADHLCAQRVLDPCHRRDRPHRLTYHQAVPRAGIQGPRDSKRSRAREVLSEVFPEASQQGDLELIQVSDMAAAGAFDCAITGVSGVVHVATISTADPDPNNVIPQTVAGVSSLLRAAAREPTVLEFVYTSSHVTASFPQPGVEGRVTSDTWNDAAVSLGGRRHPMNQ